MKNTDNEKSELEFNLEIKKMKESFFLSKQEILNIANKLKKDMQEKKYLMMLPSNLYINENINVNIGKYISLDFGGTNVRVNIYKLKGNGEYENISQTKFVLKGKEIDYLSGDYELLDLFIEIAKRIKEMINDDEHYYLGHCISRAFISKGINCANIINSPSGFRIRDLEKVDVNETLKKALDLCKLNVEPVCVVNDTTSVLVGGRYIYPDVDISCVIGTGYNVGMIHGNGQVINTESGAFSDFDLKYYDEKYFKLRDRPKDKCNLMNGFVAPGSKAVILANLVMDEFVSNEIMEPIEKITPQMLSLSLEGVFDEKLSQRQKTFLAEVAKAIYIRGAKLISAQIFAILQLIDANLEHSHGVMFEGSTVANAPYLKYIKETLYDLYGKKAENINCYFKQDVAIVGACVAAAMVSKRI